MSSNYTGNPTATQAPGPQPAVQLLPVASLPADGDALSAASIAQAHKEAMDWIAFLAQKASATGDDFNLNDDFQGGGFNPGYWGGSVDAAFTSIASSAGCGLLHGTYGSAGQKTIKTMQMNLAQRDFILAALVRVPSIPGDGEVFVGLNDGSTGIVNWFIEPATVGNPNWWYEDVDFGSGVDSGVASSTTVFQLLTISRFSNVITAAINGTVKHTAAFTHSLYDWLEFGVVRGAGGTTTFEADYLKLWVRSHS